MHQADHAEFLRQVPLFSGLTETDLQQICRQVSELRLAPGDTLFSEGSPGQHAYVIKAGLIEIYKRSGGQKVQLAVRQPGEVIGELSLFDSAPRNASGAALTDSLLIVIGHDQIERLLATNPVAASTMLRTVVERLQSTEASLRQSEKMAQLGAFTAGIAHEINNPAAAVLRGTEQVKITLQHWQERTRALCALLATSDQEAHFTRLRADVLVRAVNPPQLNALARMDQEAVLESWLEAQNVLESWQLTPQLVSLGYDADSIQAASGSLPEGSLPAMLHWMAAEAEATRLLDEIHQGAARIADIVRALKSYAYLDQAPHQEIDIHEGLENTLVILRHKLRQGVEVVRAYDRSLPPVPAYGSELNQVWTNLIDNAIDAMQGAGRLTLTTRRDGDAVEVVIEDTGEGISPEAQAKLFTPFFTTKPVGQGTGLGLNISYRIVQKHGGRIQVSSQPGQTRFIVRLPLSGDTQHGWG